MRTMYDSTAIADMPTDGDLVGYYCDGLNAVSQAAVRARFPNATLVPISAIGTDDGIVGDCELGDMTTAQLVDWVLARRAAGFDPTGYVNELNGWWLAKTAFAARSVPEPHWWVANYDGDPTIPPGAIAKQFRGSWRTPPIGTGAHYDQSSVADSWPGVDGVYGPAGGSLGGLDMATADQIYTELRGDGTYSKLDMLTGVGGKGGGQLDRIEGGIKALAVPPPARVDIPALVAALTPLIKPVDLAPVLAAIAAEHDAVAALATAIAAGDADLDTALGNLSTAVNDVKTHVAHLT